MPRMAIPFLLESALVDAVETYFSTGLGGIPVLPGTGAEFLRLPAVIVQLTSATEDPENSGNFTCEMELTVYGKLDPDNPPNNTFAIAVGAHEAICGGLHEFITDNLSLSDFETNPKGATNNVKAYNVRFTGFTRSIDSGDSAFEDVFTIEIYCKEET